MVVEALRIDNGCVLMTWGNFGGMNPPNDVEFCCVMIR